MPRSPLKPKPLRADGWQVEELVRKVKDATMDTINAAFKEAASDKSYKGVLEFSDEPLVSQDIVGNPHSCIFDSKLTLTIGNRFVKVVGWYDNEWGYSNRCVELMEMLAD